MKRVTFIILWMLAFTALIFIVGMVGFVALGFAGIASWPESTVVLIGRTWSFVFFAVPVLGLILGIWGKLPGTRRIKREAHV